MIVPTTRRSPPRTRGGLDLRRRDGRMAFLRLGSYILEVVERDGDPARFWGVGAALAVMSRRV